MGSGIRSASVLTLGLAASLAASAQAAPTDERIAFASNRDGNSDVYVMNADGTFPTRLTRNAAFDGFPTIRADGSRIAFASTRDGNDEIYVMFADGSDPRRLTFNPSVDTFPSFSPDGTRIAFASNRDGNSEIYAMNADGSSPTRLTRQDAFDGFPSWSPDSQRIVFTSTRAGQDSTELYTMRADGSDVKRVTNNSLDEVSPAQSPDGRRFLFSAADSDGDSDIYRINADGSGQTALTSEPPPFPPVIGSPRAADESPSWSRDGTRIAISTNRDGNPEIYVMNADGSGPQNLTQHAGDDAWPSFAQVPRSGPGSGPLSGTGRVRPSGVSLLGNARCAHRVTRRRCTIRVRGVVRRPAGTRAGCTGGRVAVAVRLRRRKVLAATARTASSCSYRLRKVFYVRSKRRVRTLRVAARFGGNGFISPRRSKTTRISVR